MARSAILRYLFGNSRLVAKLEGHQGAVMMLVFSPSGLLLSSGGVDGLHIWDIKAKKELPIPQLPYHDRAQVTAVIWITRHNEAFDTLCYGNALGVMAFIQHRPTEGRFEIIRSVRLAKGGEILSLAADTSGESSTRIAATTCDKCVQIWSFDSNSRTLASILSFAYDEDKEIIPKVVAFTKNSRGDFLVFGLYDGGIHSYRGDNGKWLSTHQLRSKIGNAAIDINQGLCVVDNVGCGFDIYHIEDGKHVQSLSTRDPIKTYPKGVAFAGNGWMVVAGSDHGLLYIFDQKDGSNLQTLRYAREGGVQCVATHDEDDMMIIASASASNAGETAVIVWEWERPAKGVDKMRNCTSMFEMVVKMIVLCAAAAYFIDIMQPHEGMLNILLTGPKSHPSVPNGAQHGIKVDDSMGEDTVRDYIWREMMELMDATTLDTPRGQEGRRGPQKQNEIIFL